MHNPSEHEHYYKTLVQPQRRQLRNARLCGHFSGQMPDDMSNGSAARRALATRLKLAFTTVLSILAAKANNLSN
jgi:hypothetical protein